MQEHYETPTVFSETLSQQASSGCPPADLLFESSFSPENIAAAREHVHHPDPKIRCRWISFLAQNGPCNWDDIYSWALDPDEDIRWRILYSIGSTMDAAGYLCSTDKARCTKILSEAAEKYMDMQVGITMCELAKIDKEWLELTWQAADELIEHAGQQLRTTMVCGYLEHVVMDNNWGPEDPHIRRWIEGDNLEKKLILLKMATYLGLSTGRMWDIVKALSDGDEKISPIAHGVLDGKISHSDIPG